MASFDVKLTNTAALKKQIAQIVTDKYLAKIMRQAQIKALDKIKSALIDSFERTLLLQALDGFYEGDENRDAPAHLGMPDQYARKAVEAILQTIRDNFELESIVTSREGVIGFRATIQNLTSVIESIPDAYKTIYSERSGESLPWLEWVLYGGSNIDYSINFNAKRLKSPPNRSGRATMVDLGIEGWDIETYQRFAHGENFVQDAVLDPIWIQQSVSIIIEFVQKELDSLNE